MATLVPAAVGAHAPGPVVADVHAQLGFGTSYPFGPVGWGAIEPELLFPWPDGRGLGVGLTAGIGGAYSGSTFLGGIGPKCAVVGRFGRSPFCSKFSAGLSALCSFPEGIIGRRAVLELGVVPLVAGRAAFPIEALLSSQFRVGTGLAATLGLGAGFGWVFGNESPEGQD